MCADGIIISPFEPSKIPAFPITEKFDKILLDAPCSGFGVLSKRVDLRWKRTQQDVENLQKLQLRLLDVAANEVADGGLIVYSTCSVETDENERVVEKFLEKHPEFTTESLEGLLPDKFLWKKTSVRTFPHRHQMDGSYAVRLRKITQN